MESQSWVRSVTFLLCTEPCALCTVGAGQNLRFTSAQVHEFSEGNSGLILCMKVLL